MGEKTSEGEKSITGNRDTIQVSLSSSVSASKFVRPSYTPSISIQNNSLYKEKWLYFIY